MLCFNPKLLNNILNEHLKLHSISAIFYVHRFRKEVIFNTVQRESTVDFSTFQNEMIFYRNNEIMFKINLKEVYVEPPSN